MAIKNIFKGISDKMAENADVIKQFCKPPPIFTKKAGTNATAAT